MSSHSHKDLEVWQKARTMVTSVYVLTKQFPKEEIYSLTNQIRRAAISIPSNIAEGRAKRTTRDFVKYIAIARGSAAELETQLLISQNLGYTSGEHLKSLLEDVNEVGRMLSGLLSGLESTLSVAANS